jgi:tRNA pseudouridine13 synthase
MRPRGVIKRTPEDFVVDEIPAYEPSGTGDHVYVRFRKRNRNTDDVVREIVRAAGVEQRECGVAGLKDKAAVTTQWMSVLGRGGDLEDRIRALAAFDRIAKEGVPNAFGAQRFGRDGDNVERARAWLTGKERAPQDARLRRFHFSAVQAAIFNAVLDERVKDGTWNVPIDGDILEKEDTGGRFVCADVQLDRERAARGELCPTGPILGDRMRQPERDALALEQRIAAPFIEGIDLVRARRLGEGTRRPLRLRVEETLAELMNSPSESSKSESSEGTDLRVRFVLAKGSYATTVLSGVFELGAGDE